MRKKSVPVELFYAFAQSYEEEVSASTVFSLPQYAAALDFILFLFLL